MCALVLVFFLSKLGGKMKHSSARAQFGRSSRSRQRLHPRTRPLVSISPSCSPPFLGNVECRYIRIAPLFLKSPASLLVISHKFLELSGVRLKSLPHGTYPTRRAVRFTRTRRRAISYLPIFYCICLLRRRRRSRADPADFALSLLCSCFGDGDATEVN